MQTAEQAGLIPRNAVFIWDNYIDNAYSLTPTSEVATLPASNLQNGLRTKVWRTTGCALESLFIRFNAISTVRAIGWIGDNLSSAAQIRIQIGDQGTFTGEYGEGEYGEGEYGGADCLYDETINLTDMGTGFGAVNFGRGGFGGGAGGVVSRFLSASQLAPPTVHFLGLTDAGVEPAGLYAKITFIDPYNLDGFLQFGRIYIADYLESAKNYLYGLQAKLIDPSESVLSDGGIDWRNRKDPYMTIDMSIKNLSYTEANRDFLQMFYEVQTTQNFIFMRRPNTQDGRLFLTHYGCFQGEIPMVEDFYNSHSINLQFKEVR